MSALGQKRTLERASGMSTLPPKAAGRSLAVSGRWSFKPPRQRAQLGALWHAANGQRRLACGPPRPILALQRVLQQGNGQVRLAPRSRDHVPKHPALRATAFDPQEQPTAVTVVARPLQCVDLDGSHPVNASRHEAPHVKRTIKLAHQLARQLKFAVDRPQETVTDTDPNEEPILQGFLTTPTDVCRQRKTGKGLRLVPANRIDFARFFVS